MATSISLSLFQPLFCLYFREAKQIGSWNTDSGLEIEDDQSYDVTGHETPSLMVVTIELHNYDC